MIIPRMIALGLLCAPAAGAQRIDPTSNTSMSAGLAEDIIELRVNYTDSRIVLFATTPQPQNETSGMAVALIGPISPQKMIRNTTAGAKTIEFVAAPQVFMFGAEPQVKASVEADTLTEQGLTAKALIIPEPDQLVSPEIDAWQAAFVKLQQDRGLYDVAHTSIERLDGGLRRIRIQLPTNAPPGEYRVRAVAFRDGHPVGESQQRLTIIRSGLDATLFDLSRQHGLIYACLAVLMGCLVGGAAAWFGRR